MFVGAMAVMTTAVYAIVDHGFKANLLRACDDDLRAIRGAYATASPPERGLHEATEMIEDRTAASDVQNQFLLQLGGNRKVAGNMAVMAPKAGVLYLNLLGTAAADSPREILGRGEFIAPGAYAFVGRDLEQVQRSEREILLTFAAVLAASVVLAGASGAWLSGRYLRRVDDISETCGAIMAGDLAERISAGGAGGELDRLAETINRMLDRIQALMESLRQVTNDIAHDLRTPLAHLRLSLERTQTEARTRRDYELAVQHAIGEADQMLDMFAALLRIARIESGARREAFRPFDLGEVLTEAFAIYQPLIEDAGLAAELCVGPGLLVNGDRQLVLQMVTNLLDNTLHHTAPGTRVAGWAGLQHGCPTLVIADTGPGIPASDRKRVLRRFVRLDQSRSAPGHGLGLSMVAAIAEVHDGRLSLMDNVPGLRVCVQFAAIDTDAAVTTEEARQFEASRKA